MKKNSKGFTLAELLIVVAIIAVLTAIAIPVFSSQLEKSREATDLANVRSAYASLVADYLSNTEAAAEKSVTVPATQKEDNWQNGTGVLEIMIDGTASQISVPVHKAGENYTITIATNGTVSVT